MTKLLFLFLPWIGCSADGVPLDPTMVTDSGTADSGSLPDVGTGAPDSGASNHAPAVTVEFPAAVSLTDATFVTVRGVASDDDGVKAVRINGVIADSIDGFASWELNLRLSPGENTFVVSSEDPLGNTDLDAARVVVTSEPLLFMEPSAVAIDPATGRALVVDPRHDRLVAVDLANGDRTLMSGHSKGSGPALSSPVGIAVDAARRRAIVLDAPPFPDSAETVLVAVDLDTGDRTIISGTTIGVGPPFSAPRGVAVDDVNNRALVLESGFFGALIAIDLETGDRTIISDAATGSGRSLQNCTALAFDETQGRAIAVLDTTGGTALIAIDLGTGDRTSITDPALEFGMQRPHGVALDAANDRALVAIQVGGWDGGLLAIDLSTGDSLLLSDSTIGAGPDFQEMVAVSFDATTRRAQVINLAERSSRLGIPELLTVDIDTGDRAFASVRAIGAGPAMTSPIGVALDAANNRALVVESRGVLAAVDLSTGDRAIVSEPQLGPGEGPFSPADVTLDEANGRVLVVDVSRNVLVSIDLSTGADTIESVAPEPMRMKAVALDAATNRALITGYPGGGGTSMIAVDLSNGNQSVLIDANGGMAADFGTLDGVTVDAANATALVTSRRADSLFALDLVTGDRTVVSDDAIGTGPPLSSPDAVVFEASERRAIIIASAGLMAVDLDTGERAIVSSAETGAGPMLTYATDVALSSSPRCVWVVDQGLEAMLLVDLATGQRVIASGHSR